MVPMSLDCGMGVTSGAEHGTRSRGLQIGRKSCMPYRSAGRCAPGSGRVACAGENGSTAVGGRAMHRTILAFSGAVLVLCAPALAAPDYAKRLQALEPALRTRLLGRWTNPVDWLVIEISSIDLASGQIRGKVSPTSGPAAANEHELIGWVSAAAHKESYDNVVP